MTYREWRRYSYIKRAAYLPLVAIDTAWAKLVQTMTARDRHARSFDLSWFTLVGARVPARGPIYRDTWGRYLATATV